MTGKPKPVAEQTARKVVLSYAALSLFINSFSKLKTQEIVDADASF